MRIHKLALTLFFFLSSLACAAQVKLEKIGGVTDAAVPPSIRSVLQPEGSRVLRADGTPLADLWLRKTLPAPAAAAAGDVLYPELSPSMMVGVISFPTGARDFRGQAIKAGFYSLRYELLPEDGNHLGVAPNRDFLLLLPTAADPDPNAAYEFRQMVKLSAQAAGTSHPATFALLPPESGKVSRAFENADSFTVFAGSWKTESGKNVPFELVLKGEASQ